MGFGCEVPVLLFLFNRPSKLARVVDVLLRVRPKLVFAFADGPRRDHPDDNESCRAARALVERLEGTSQVVRVFADENMGCSTRILSGLDHAFREVSEAIVLEDDIVPDASFFPWCALMLRRYRDAQQVMHVSGHNHIGRWTQAGNGHCLLRRGSCWGWATWRRAWQRDVPFPGTERDLTCGASRDADPIVLDNFLMLQDMVLSGLPSAWDTDWEIKRALVGGLSVVPSVNLTANIGFGPGATHIVDEDDIRALTPVNSAPEGAEADHCAIDEQLDRWQLLLELMATYRDPATAQRLSRFSLNPAKRWSTDRKFRHHLAPFRSPNESLAVLDHFCSAGTPAEPLGRLFAALSTAARRQPVPQVS